MARLWATTEQAVDVRAHLAARLRELITLYEGVPAATRAWQREVDRIEAGDAVTFYGWQARPLGLAPNGRYRLTTDDRIETERRPYGV